MYWWNLPRVTSLLPDELGPEATVVEMVKMKKNSRLRQEEEPFDAA